MDIAENSAFQNRRNSGGSSGTSRGVYEMAGTNTYGERREQWVACTSTSTTTTFYASRHRNLSGPCSTGSTRPPVLDNRSLATPPPGVPGTRIVERDSRDNRTKENGSGGRHGSSSSHRKLDRSLSDSEDRLNGNGGRGGGVNSSRYKTELCRPYEENGHCKYGDKCQFAHGMHELRNLTRHPKYKTERCRTFHTIGFCPYGPRCHFIHNEEEHFAALQRKNANNTRHSSSSAQKPCQFILPPSSSSSLLAHRPSNLCGLNSLGSSFESVSSSSSPGNLSPSHLEDSFPPIGTFSPSAVADSTPSREADSGSPTTIFNFPASDTTSVGSVMTPLNVQTKQFYNNMLDMAALRFNAALNISQNQLNNQSSFSTTGATNLNMCQSRQQQQPPSTSAFEVDPAESSSWCTRADYGLVVPPPSISPHFSDDSMGSNGSLELTASSSSEDSGLHLINSPLDLGRSMRLPIFNQLSAEAQSS